MGPLVCADHRVAVVQRGVRGGEVRALVRAAALLAQQGAGGDQAGERVGVAEQALEARARADDPGVAPERLLRRALGPLQRDRAWRGGARGGVGGGALWLVEPGAGGAGAEDEALAQRVGGQP